jgi:hypothetical protein
MRNRILLAAIAAVGLLVICGIRTAKVWVLLRLLS